MFALKAKSAEHQSSSISNQPMPRLLGLRANETRNTPGLRDYGSDVPSAADHETVPSWSFSKIPLSADRAQRPPPCLPPPRLPVPAKLKVGAVDDPLESEADRVADQVMPMPAADAALSSAPLQISRKSAPGPQAADGGAPACVHQALRSPGQPLDAPTRAFFEARLGRDFDDVRLHVGASAAESVDAVDARAYTVGRDIVFGTGMFAPATLDGGRLLAHELTHVAQQAGARPFLQRDPKTPKPGAKDGPTGGDKKPDKIFPVYNRADSILEISRDNDTWSLTVDGVSDEPGLRHLIWPRLVPPRVNITFKVAVTDPIERGWFTLTGVTYRMLKETGAFAMDPSIAKLFADHGLEDEETESASVKDARAAFRAQHRGHGDWVLDAIDVALRRITKRNPELLISYYKYYETHDLKDKTHLFDGIDFDPSKEAGATAGGNTVINPSLLRLEPPKKFPTDDPISLLGSTLLHEYTHTPQPSTSDPVTSAQFESKAYGVEVFFSRRTGDNARVAFIEKRSTNDQVDRMSGGDKIYQATQAVMEALYRLIDNGGPAAEEARAMSAEFISKNSVDYGPKLKDFIAKIPGGDTIP